MGDSAGKNLTLFDNSPALRDEWRGMPEFIHQELTPWKSLKVHFASRGDYHLFAHAIGQRLTSDTRSVWFPSAEIGHYADREYRSNSPRNPKYPVYVISKGRWKSRLTVRSLEKIGVPYRIVVEPQEYAAYASVIPPELILTLPFSNLGQGSIPARNWVWEHSISEGASSHWILDDNISGFYRFQNNLKCPVADGTIFAAAESFVDRYENVALSGFHYFMFVKRKSGKVQPFTLNSRIYSCILIRNDLAYRWRGRYNEDTDLSLRVLKGGLCTILFNAFICGKEPTMTMKGGNTDELYKDDGRLKMAESLRDQHPDVVKIVRKWGRWQHYVDYRPFRKNKLKLRADSTSITESPDNFGMYLRLLNDGEIDGSSRPQI